jgi:hypothetical protein
MYVDLIISLQIWLLVDFCLRINKFPNSYKNMKKEFRSFTDTREFTQSLNLKSRTEWDDYSKSNKKPVDIPASPRAFYKNKGWISWGDFLGTGTIAPQNKQFLSFDDARKFVKSLELKSITEWNKYCISCNKPPNIPSNPDKSYKNKGWEDYPDWLGYERKNKLSSQLWPYEKARAYVHKLNLTGEMGWRAFSKSGKLPKEIPKTPHYSYKNKGWEDYPDWLGYERKNKLSSQLWPYEKARAYVHKLNLTGEMGWRAFSKSGKLPKEIPQAPYNSYKNKGWISWGDFLGTGTIPTQQRSYWPYEKARAYVHKLNLKGGKEWGDYCKSEKKPQDIPNRPSHVYKNKGWNGMGDWLGTGNIAATVKSKNYSSFSDARNEARKLAKKYNLTSYDDWYRAYREGKIPDNIPLKPERVYSEKRKK